ncbi:hypothetical protein FSS13T_18550 [Flavobacterium saliperosum S13]|uniref:Lipoprotein n=2 Tax=Flavobacterium saliperosum TaxID=329186 RepID=A0A1G4W9S3_9FLAO|nr:hypothetical protein [Flavobacterium saliperosum]ESU25271.1 hypothetical protein FSS13T_18550 [Flavobacterium saliperosum S13]SCX19101.1 hypothetical protein SAMN02927925_02768 [Flavobacterium saliperosum]
MRNITYFFLLLILISCNKKNKEFTDFIPKEYQYPIKKIGKGKSLHYQRMGSIDGFEKINLSKVKESNTEFLIYSRHDKHFLLDSIKTTLDGKLVEIYNFNLLRKIEPDHFKGIKGKLINNKIVDDGSKFGKRISTILYQGKHRNITIYEEERYLCDTILKEDLTSLKCIVTETKSTIQYKKKNVSVGMERIKTKSYYAKNKGLYLIEHESKDDSSAWIKSFEENIIN